MLVERIYYASLLIRRHNHETISNTSIQQSNVMVPKIIQAQEFIHIHSSIKAHIIKCYVIKTFTCILVANLALILKCCNTLKKFILFSTIN